VSCALCSARLSDMKISPVLDDMLKRKWVGGRMIATVNGSWVTFDKSNDLDLYVCGFMCNPFTPNGRREVCR
jgi:hypothetical protein